MVLRSIPILAKTAMFDKAALLRGVRFGRRTSVLFVLVDRFSVVRFRVQSDLRVRQGFPNSILQAFRKLMCDHQADVVIELNVRVHVSC